MSKNKVIYMKKEELCTEVLLSTAKSCFEHEYDRTKRIEGKANMCIVIIGIIFTLLVGYLEFNYFNDIWRGVCITIFAISGISYLISIGCFIKVLALKGYNVLDYATVFSDDNFQCLKQDMEECLIRDYRGMLQNIKEVNESKADWYKYGIIATTVGTSASFILIFMDFIM